jgi:hypothetical protein
MKKIDFFGCFIVIILLFPVSILQGKGVIEMEKSTNGVSNPTYFNATKAYKLIKEQVEFGPRIPGSEAIEKTRIMLENEVLAKGLWEVEYQNFSKLWIDDQNISLVNIIYTPNTFNSNQPYFILLAHYDSRLWADNDPDQDMHRKPVLGANDGASGVAVAIELGNVLNTHHNISNFKILLVDAEDQGNIPNSNGWDWLLGSRHFVSSKLFQKDAVSFLILFDMVGGNNAIFKREGYSDTYAHFLVSKIWRKADELGYNQYFVNKTWNKIVDDHIPFLEQGIPAVDIIDDFIYNYKAWHTTNDTLDQISIETLEAVGKTVELAIIDNNLASSLTSFSFQTSVIFSVIIVQLFLLTLVRKSQKKNT